MRDQPLGRARQTRPDAAQASRAEDRLTRRRVAAAAFATLALVFGAPPALGAPPAPGAPPAVTAPSLSSSTPASAGAPASAPASPIAPAPVAESPADPLAAPAATAAGVVTPDPGAPTLELDDCIRRAVFHSPALEAARARVAQIDADAILERSRFLPTVELVHSREWVGLEDGTDIDDDGTLVRWSQRLFEYGKDPESARRLREDQRRELYAYEDALRDLISAVRSAFYSAILKERQIEIRRQVRANFYRRYEEVRARHEGGTWVDRTTLLQAELNVKTEDRRIIALQRERTRTLIELARLMGESGPSRFEIRGEFVSPSFGLEEIVGIARERSTEVALASEQVWERHRELDRLRWEYAPDLSLEAGVTDGDNSARLGLVNEEDVWGMDLGTESHLSTPDDPEFFGTERGEVLPDDAEWFARVTLRLPIFEGMARRGRTLRVREELREAEALLDEQLDQVDAEVRAAWETLQEQRLLMENSEQIARNSEETLNIKQEIKDILPERVSDNELETFRERFFRDQDAFFADQDRVIAAIEELRRLAGWFE